MPLFQLCTDASLERHAATDLPLKAMAAQVRLGYPNPNPTLTLSLSLSLSLSLTLTLT